MVSSGSISYNAEHQLTTTDPGTGKVFTTCPDLAAEDVDPIVQYSHFQTYKTINPRTRAQLLLK